MRPAILTRQQQHTLPGNGVEAAVPDKMQNVPRASVPQSDLEVPPALTVGPGQIDPSGKGPDGFREATPFVVGGQFLLVSWARHHPEDAERAGHAQCPHRLQQLGTAN